MTRYWAAKEERSPFAHACVQYIASASERRRDFKSHIVAVNHVLSILEKPADPITEYDKHEIGGYILRSFLFSDYKGQDREDLIQPVQKRVQAMIKTRIDAAVEEPDTKTPPVATVTFIPIAPTSQASLADPTKTAAPKEKEAEGMKKEKCKG